MDNYGLIVQHLRHQAGMSVQQAAQKIGRSVGWLSEIENNSGRCRLTESEFNRIVGALDGAQHRFLFKSWVANQKNRERTDKTFDGAVLKFIRIKKSLRLTQAASAVGLSVAQLSKIETGAKPVSIELRNRIMTAYGYSPSSFKNLSTDPVRSKVVPLIYKLEILLKSLDDHQIEKVFHFAQGFLSAERNPVPSAIPASNSLPLKKVGAREKRDKSPGSTRGNEPKTLAPGA